MSYEPILALLLYTDSYIDILNLIFGGLAKYWGGGNCPPPPVSTAMFKGLILIWRSLSADYDLVSR